MNNTSPTIKSIIASSAVDDATVECMASCQASDVCEYWTLDVQNQICQLKELKSEMVPSESAVSGGKLCRFGGTCATNQTMLWCKGRNCNLGKTIKGDFCSDKITLEMLSGDYNAWNEFVSVYINGVFVEKCKPTYYYQGNSPQWYKCGVYTIPSGRSFIVSIASGALYYYSLLYYNGIPYTHWARVTYSVYTAEDFFATAATCPNATEMDLLEECTDVSCGGHCYATRTLPNGNSNYNINNCLAGGKYYSIFIRICNGLSSHYFGNKRKYY